MYKEFSEIKNKKKLSNILEKAEELQALKRAIDGFKEIISDKSTCYKLLGDDHSRCEIYGIDYEIAKNAFKAAKKVFEDAYTKASNEIDELLTKE